MWSAPVDYTTGAQAMARILSVDRRRYKNNSVSDKARVASAHHTMIPRLEFMTALIASGLAQKIHKEFKSELVKVTFWSDSTTVLEWLRSRSASFKIFVEPYCWNLGSLGSSRCSVPTVHSHWGRLVWTISSKVKKQVTKAWGVTFSMRHEREKHSYKNPDGSRASMNGPIRLSQWMFLFTEGKHWPGEFAITRTISKEVRTN